MTQDERVKDRFRRRTGSRRMSSSLFLVLAPMLLCSACTTYLPLDQGAPVPWANALAVTKGGPLDDNRYRVGKGDALSGIASRYDVRLSTLAAANNIKPPYVLYPGEVLRIPADAPMPARRPEIIQTALPQAEVLPPAEPKWKRQSEPEAVREVERYVVASGESLALIAVRYGLTLGDLVVANDLEPPYQIRPGQELIIPPKESSIGDQEESAHQTAGNASSPMAPPPPLSADGFIWPVDGELIGNFEQNSQNGRSGGITIAARKGAPVRAADNGIVAYAGEALSGYGRMIMLRHADGYVTLYAHNDALLVREGDVVDRGQTIAEVGSSGDVVESQLHFELRKGKAPIDPAKVLAGLPGRQLGRL
ncbi:MAG: peptidoglycan DD-metalloendopeptidase family protein [Geminicoccaceae bacterium]